MGKFVTACIQESEVKVVHGTTKWGAPTPINLETVPLGKFDNYLEKEKVSEFVVISDFEESFHNILLIPSLKKKYLRKVIESEIRKTSQQSDFTFIYTILGEKVVDNRKMLEIFYYMVTNETIRKVVERFYDNGKIVKALYPAVFTAASMLEQSNAGGIKMGVIVSGHKRIVFTTKNGAVNFIRDYESLEDSVSDFDVQNVNMTLNYCTQNLRMTPESVTFLGEIAGLSELKAVTDVPIVQPDMPDDLKCDCKTGCGYPVPCASFKPDRSFNILSGEFRNIYIFRRLMEAASLTFVMLSVVYLALIFYVGENVIDTRQQIQTAARGLAGTESDYAEYLERRETMSDILPFVDFMNKPSIDISRLLAGLSEVRVKDLRFAGIDARAVSDTAFLVSINGKGQAETYSSFQASFERLLAGLEEIENVELSNRVINHMDGTFSVQLRYGK